jgi:translocation protein SEC63
MNTSKLYNYFIMKNPQMLMKRVIMILSASLEFERGSNPEIKERPTDNIEVPKV